MMEIKYKVWCKNKNEWEKDECFLSTEGDISQIKGCMLKRCKAGTHIVVRYTGLKDKNGKDIYEGDICIGRRGGNPDLFLVKWDDENARFLGYDKNGKMCYVGQEPRVEVIGNIYENPELVEVE